MSRDSSVVLLVGMSESRLGLDRLFSVLHRKRVIVESVVFDGHHAALRLTDNRGAVDLLVAAIEREPEIVSVEVRRVAAERFAAAFAVVAGGSDR